ncbi:hypothetical protein CcaCcLH18_03628 [Colletotrichum camelliae]|nr:hypothetical protein CcaCcLH18_03628 [Colletotrichum camelliae]
MANGRSAQRPLDILSQPSHHRIHQHRAKASFASSPTKLDRDIRQPASNTSEPFPDHIPSRYSTFPPAPKECLSVAP